MLLVFATEMQGQVLDNSFLNGRYGFRQLLISTNMAGQPIEARGFVGILSFDGRGTFSFQGTRNLGSQAPSTFAGGGSYSVSPTGIVAMNNPLEPNATLNARLGNGLLLGSTTDSTGNLFDLFVALPLPSAAAANSLLTGNFVGASMELPAGSFFNIKNSFLRFSADGRGNIGQMSASGQAVQTGGRLTQQAIGPLRYGINNDGSGLLIVPPTAPFPAASQLVLGDKQIFVSANGEMFVGGSTAQGAHDLIFGMKALPDAANAGNFNGNYFGAGFRVEQSRPSSFAGAVNALGTGRVVWSRRARLPEGNVDSTALNDYTIAGDGAGSLLGDRFALGVSNNAFLATAAGLKDTDSYGIIIGIRARAVTGTGVFLNPAGVLNAGSFAPAGNPISPGQFVSLFGNGLGPPSPVVASGTPFPTTLVGVGVTIQGRPAPLYFVSENQISALVPFATSGTTAEITVRSGGQESNRVTVPVSRTSPGIYSLSQNGVGPGAILKANFSVVSAANAAKRGETVLIYLTGLGALSPALADGAAASNTVLSRVTDSVNVYIGGQKAAVSFAGAAPGFAGLYQLNVVIPAASPLGSSVPVAIETTSSFHDMVDIAIAP